jgi:glycosyltransferase involved in cell wall biosynthesis
MTTVLLMHRGGATIRGSEQCLIENAAGLHHAGMRVLLLRNHPCVDPAITPYVERIIPFDYAEIMLNGRHSRLPVAAYVKRLGSLRRVVHEERVSALLANGGLPCQLGVPASRLCGIPILCQFHHPATRRYMYLWMVHWADRLFFPSNFTRMIVLQRVGRGGDVVYNGVDVARFVRPSERVPDLRRALGIPDNGVVIGQVAALVPHKRHRLLVSAFAQALNEYPNLYLVMVGVGPEQTGIEQRVEQLGIQAHVRLTGYVASTLEYYQHVFDVNALVSAEEGLGISVIEGAAAGLPTIAADATGLREAVIADETALVFPVDDEHALAACIRRLAASEALRRTLGENGRALVESTFSRDQYRARVVDIVRDTIRDHAHT